MASTRSRWAGIDLVAHHPDSNDCARGEATVPSENSTVVEDLTMRGFGGLVITVLYADGSPAVGASVNAVPAYPPPAAAAAARWIPSDASPCRT